MDIYAENILDHFKHPRNMGEIKDASIIHTEENLSCGDSLTLSLKLKDKHIVIAQWKGTGCAISQAAISILSEELGGKTLTEILKLQPNDIYKLLGVPIGPQRVKCALLCLHTVKNALHKYQKSSLQSWIQTVGEAA